jgi:hypothetical protein
MAIDFDWNGVRIDSAEEKIFINSHEYNFEDIRKCQLETVSSCFGKAGTILIYTNDLKHPIFKVKTVSVFSDIEGNYARISMLLNLR